jgi:hypothetical protein
VNLNRHLVRQRLDSGVAWVLVGWIGSSTNEAALKAEKPAFACDLNSSIEHLISIYRDEDAANEIQDQDYYTEEQKALM